MIILWIISADFHKDYRDLVVLRIPKFEESNSCFFSPLKIYDIVSKINVCLRHTYLFLIYF